MSSEGILANRVAIVTGASKGIGRALAGGLAAAGAHVVVNFKNDEKGARETCQLIRDAGGVSLGIQADVSVRAEVSELVGRTVSELGQISVLVNNAGRTRFGPAADVTEDDWDDVINTNLKGAFFTTMAAAANMVEGGSVVNISSCAATLMIRDHAVYTTSKGGLEAMTRQLALELAPRVRVNAISPAATSMERNWEYDTGFDDAWGEVTPMARVAKPEDYIDPLIFLASGSSRFMTGEILHVDGGWTLKGHYPQMDHYNYDSDRQRG